MEIGFFGLGRMGGNMVERLVKGGHRVVAGNRSPEPVKAALAKGAVAAFTPKELVGWLTTKPRVVWVMVPSGDATEAMLKEFAGLLSPGDILVDGGNSNFRDSQRRSKELAEKGLLFLDAGTSGGIWGLKLGYCMMLGGPESAFKQIEPAIATLAPKDGYLYCGPSGAGHFVKMVHNGIEYGMMQSYAEGFELLKASGFPLELSKVSHLWNQGSVVRSWLLELAEDAFSHDPDLAKIKGYVADSGEGRWTVMEGIEHGVPMDSLAHALFARFRSRQDDSFAMKVLAALRNEFGGHAVKSS